MDPELMIAGGALLVSVVALWVSIAAYRQKARFHPQPYLEAEWSRVKVADGVYYRTLRLYNRGDAPARALEVRMEHTVSTGPWDRRESLGTTENDWWNVEVPIVDHVERDPDPTALRLRFLGHPASYQTITPKVVVSWLAPPYDKGRRKSTFTGPASPSIPKD